MGLYLNYDLRLPATWPAPSVRALLVNLQAFACTLPFKQVSPVLPVPNGADRKDAREFELLQYMASIYAVNYPIVDSDDGADAVNNPVVGSDDGAHPHEVAGPSPELGAKRDGVACLDSDVDGSADSDIDIDASSDGRADADANADAQFDAEIVTVTLTDPDPRLVGDTSTVQGFFVRPGDWCETAVFAVLREPLRPDAEQHWYWHFSCKTQYAANVSDAHLIACHTSLVLLLDYAAQIGFEVVVDDETYYWESRDAARLVAEVGAMNRIMANFAGALSDRLGEEHPVEAPIFEHPNFERLEMGQDE